MLPSAIKAIQNYNNCECIAKTQGCDIKKNNNLLIEEELKSKFFNNNLIKLNYIENSSDNYFVLEELSLEKHNNSKYEVDYSNVNKKKEEILKEYIFISSIISSKMNTINTKKKFINSYLTPREVQTNMDTIKEFQKDIKDELCVLYRELKEKANMVLENLIDEICDSISKVK